mmetsp:Transcript_10145/g.11646  ORF Transcript_10145/g.11646 Transcript_10145/m.11646 type:complete len:382 (+) Transcript_10145:155-1300(+)|eukprot:CAMPEP_0184027814 /NCGR_PEP_ID=MMETSP0954-20121128/14423_1 /TAXON_ID=627963 /ORGANISM="Aplanochytrium sp, Strain PBS07" /LENGTH=381 /DNA_ID=CAMNT_0026312447 /DNA_START=50 /DNA_END=1195 /DNA_ORIENTATION=+
MADEETQKVPRVNSLSKIETALENAVENVVDEAANDFRKLVWLGFETTFGLMFILLCVIFIFGAILQNCEADTEIADNKAFVALMEEIRASVSNETYTELQRFTDRDPVTGLEGFTHFIEEGKWVKNDLAAVTASASYVFDLASTIGYGSFTAKTNCGRAWSIVCIVITFPLAVLAYTRFANFLYNTVSGIIVKTDSQLNKVVEKYGSDGSLDRGELREIFHALEVNVTDELLDHVLTKHDLNGDGKLDVDEFQEFAVSHKLRVGVLGRPWFQLEFAICIFFAFSLLYTLLAYFMMDFTFFEAFYFTIVTVSTVGLGDIVPDQQYSGFFSLMAFFGVGFTALLLKAVVDKMYEKTDYQSLYMARRMREEAKRDSNDPAADI